MVSTIYINSAPSFRPETKTKTKTNIKSNKFGGYYENGKKFSKEKWSEICFIYIALEEDLGRKPTRRELASAAHVSENSARRAIRMVRTGAFDLKNETEGRSLKETIKITARTNATTKHYLPNEKCSPNELFCERDNSVLFDTREINQLLWMTMNSLNWKLTITPSSVFPMQNTMTLMKEFHHYTSSEASKFASIIANVVDKKLASNIRLQQHAIEGIFSSRVEYSFPGREAGLTISDFRAALSIESLVSDSILSYNCF